jgi:hypothetical protein
MLIKFRSDIPWEQFFDAIDGMLSDAGPSPKLEMEEPADKQDRARSSTVLPISSKELRSRSLHSIGGRQRS